MDKDFGCLKGGSKTFPIDKKTERVSRSTLLTRLTVQVEDKTG